MYFGEVGLSRKARACVASVAVGSALVTVATAADARAPTHIACVGDSITHGSGDKVPRGSTPLGPYPTQLAALFERDGTPVTVRNFGHSGATALSSGDKPYVEQPEYQEATDFVATAGASAVVDVVIMLGTNDSKSKNWRGGASSAAFASDYAALIRHFASQPTKPSIYVMVPPAAFSNRLHVDGGTLSREIDPVIRAVARQESATLIDLYTPTAGLRELSSDGVHPTDAGYSRIAGIVESALLSGPQGRSSPEAPSATATASGVTPPEPPASRNPPKAGADGTSGSSTKRPGCCASPGAPPDSRGWFGAALVALVVRRRSLRRASA